jgi:hypothetical protein
LELVEGELRRFTSVLWHSSGACVRVCEGLKIISASDYAPYSMSMLVAGQGVYLKLLRYGNAFSLIRYLYTIGV